MNFHPTEEALISFTRLFLISNFNRLFPSSFSTISFRLEKYLLLPSFLFTRVAAIFFLFPSKYCLLRCTSWFKRFKKKKKRKILLYSLLMVNLVALILHSTGSRSPNSKLAETLHRPIRSLTFPEESTLGVSVKGNRVR